MKRILKVLCLIMFFGMAFQLNSYAANFNISYNGDYTTDSDNTYRYIYLKSSGTLKLTSSWSNVDVFLCGGGGGGGNVGSGTQNGGGGGGGGYQTTKYSQSIASGTYEITIGTGGASATSGGTTSAFGFSASGGSAGAAGSTGRVYYAGWGMTGDGADGGSGTGTGGSGGCYWDGGNTGYNGTAGANGKKAFDVGSTYYGAGGGGGGYKAGSGSAGGTTGGGRGGNHHSNGANGIANTGSGGGGAGGSSYEGGNFTGGSGGSGIIIIRMAACDHTGGTHANGGVCVSCGTVYQDHGEEFIGYDTESVKQEVHIAKYRCDVDGCDGTIEEEHDFSRKNGTCTKCGFRCMERIGVHLAGTYDGIERVSGECLNCGEILTAHEKTNIVGTYLQTAEKCVPYYKCSINGCSNVFVGTENEGRSHKELKAGEQCDLCGYYGGMLTVTPYDEDANCGKDVSVHKNDTAYKSLGKNGITGAIKISPISLTLNENTVETTKHDRGDKIELSGTNYANEEKIYTYLVQFISKVRTISAPLNNYFHWKVVGTSNSRLHTGPASACTVGVHSGNTEYACQNRGAWNNGNGGHYDINLADAKVTWLNKPWVFERSYGNIDNNSSNTNTKVIEKSLELLTYQLNLARKKDNVNYNVYFKSNYQTFQDADISEAKNLFGNDLNKFESYSTTFNSKNVISLNMSNAEYIHCCNSWNYGLINAQAVAAIAQSCKHNVDGHQKLYGDISVRFEGFKAENSQLTYESTSAEWPSGINADKNLVSEKANWNVTFTIGELIREEIRFEEKNGVKEPYGMVYITSTAPDGTTQTVEVKVPLKYDTEKGFEKSDSQKHFTANLYVNELAWDMESLYQPGDILELDGTRCIYNEYYTIFDETEKEFSEYNGVILNFKGFEVESGGKRFTGKDLRYNKNQKVVWQERGYDYEDADLRYWDTDTYKIVDISNATFDSERGVHYGEIEIIGLAEHGAIECMKVFRIYFGTPSVQTFYPVEVTVKVNPADAAGTVTVDYEQYISSTEMKKVTNKVVKDGDKITIVLGTSITIHSTANDGYVYRDVTTAHGNKLDGSENKDFSYGPINIPMTFIVNFEKDPLTSSDEDDRDAYILYVTSTEGGHAWIVDDRAVEGVNKFDSEVYKVTPVDGGEKFTLYYETYDGYIFDKWEYRPRIKADFSTKETSSGSVQITMPYSDLTATAVFKKVNLEEPKTDPDGNKLYKLKVTSNNEAWGNAWVYIAGSWEDGTENAIAGNPYIVYFKANPGYYFTNWDYDSADSPFEDVDKESGYGKIVMPNNDLEIKAFFSPIPEPGDNSPELPKPEYVDPTIPTPPEPDPNPDNPNPQPNPDNIPEQHLHNIYFVSECDSRCDGIGGSVPEDLINVRGGAEITMAVTPYKNFKFVRWYFTKADEHKNGNHANELALTPDIEKDPDGSGNASFIMTDYDIVAHAVFERKTPTNKLTIKIVGEGSVFVEDIDIPSGSWYDAEPDKTLNITVKPSEGWEYIYSVNEDGNVISENPNFTFKMPDEDVTLVIHFGKKGPYTLYVTSMYGGNAWTEGNDKHPRESVEVTTNHLGQYIYTIKNVYAGEKFKIYYNVNKEGYSFDEWEYRPYVEPNKEGLGIVEITMPYSDLTVTAVFKNDTTTETPKLSVTSNNPAWGNAYAIISGVPVNPTNNEAVTAGEKYIVVYEANPGYYFTNWDYSVTETPFIDNEGLRGTNKAQFIMPNKNLEIMAFFSPIPEPVPENPEEPADPKPEVKGYRIDFIAEPPEGGNVPQDLIKDDELVKPGCKVTIAVTPNQGWEFSHWYFKDENDVIIVPDVYYDEDGTGYFIMPDYDIKAIAVFKKIGTYTLYVTSTGGGSAWAVVNGVETDKVENAIPREFYEIVAKPEIGYKVTWEYKWDDDADNSIIPGIYMDELGGKVIMPRSDLTVTAIFTKVNPIETLTPTLKVTSNNYFWGNAFVNVNGEWRSWKQEGLQKASDEPGITLEAGKEYEVKFEVANDNYEFTEWISSDLENHFVEDPNLENGIGIIVMPDYDIELMAYFKPGTQEVTEKTYYTLTLISEPHNVATLIGEGLVEEGTERYVGIDNYDATEYRFIRWYREEDGKTISKAMDFDYTVWEDTTLVAEFERKASIQYNVTVIVKGNGTVKSDDGNINVSSSSTKNYLYKKGSSIKLVATEGSGYFFNGWEVNNKYCGNLSEIQVDVVGDVTIVATFIEEKIIPQGVIEDFKIISVRDLRWQDYFVGDNGKLTGRVFTAPITSNISEIMLNSGTPKDQLKMGYAVEFELVTTTYDHEKAVLVVEPKILDKNGNEVLWYKVKDALTGSMMDSDYRNQVKDFEKVIIVHNTSGKADAKKLNDYYQASYQTASSWDSNATNNGISTEKITWRWLYYLPAKLEGVNGPITIKFNVAIYEMSGDFRATDLTSATQKFDMITYLNTYKNTDWNGNVYKYHATESLLDDIYNNAT